MAATASVNIRRQRRIAIRDRLIPIFKAAEPTPFAAEGPARAGVRAKLCLSGFRWQIADEEAALLTRSALQMIGAKRPTWKQGQPEWTQDGVLTIQRERCVRCGKSLPEENYVYCGPVCAKAAKADEKRRRYEFEHEIAEIAGRTIKLERQECQQCRKSFRPHKRGQSFCSRPCYDAQRSGRRHMRLVCEGV